MFRAGVHVTGNRAGEFEIGWMRRTRLQSPRKAGKQFGQTERMFPGIGFQILNFGFGQLYGQFRRFHKAILRPWREKTTFELQADHSADHSVPRAALSRGRAAEH